MNNRGFAITTILYGLLILFLMLLISLLGMLSTYKDRLSLLIEGNNGARDIINGSYINLNADPPACTLSASDTTITATISNTNELVYYGWDSSYSGDNSTTTTISDVGTYTYYVLDSAGKTGTCMGEVSAAVGGLSCIGVGKCVAEDQSGWHCYESGGMCYAWINSTANYAGNAVASYSCSEGSTLFNDSYCWTTE